MSKTTSEQDQAQPPQRQLSEQDQAQQWQQRVSEQDTTMSTTRDQEVAQPLQQQGSKLTHSYTKPIFFKRMRVNYVNIGNWKITLMSWKAGNERKVWSRLQT